MSQPTPYERAYSFTDFSSGSPSSQPPGVQIDAELDAVGETLADVLANLALIQRDDGVLRNGAVGVDQLNSTALALISGSAFNVAGPWATLTAYSPGDIVSDSSVVYLVMEAHVAGALATDVAAGRLVSVFDAAAVALETKLALATGLGLIGTSTGENAQTALDAKASKASLLASTGLATIGEASGITAQAALDAKAATADLASATGSEMIGHIATGTGAVETTAADKLKRFGDVLDFIPTALHAGIKDGTNTTDLTTYIQAAIDAVVASGGGELWFPAGTYKTTDSIIVSNAAKCNLIGSGRRVTKITRANNTGPVIRITEASGPAQGNGYYFQWRGLTFDFTTPASAAETDAIGISFETGSGSVSYGIVNFGFHDIGIVGAHTAITNDWGAGSPPNVWGWKWDEIDIADFAARTIYLTNGGTGGFPACHLGKVYFQGRAGTTYTAPPFVCDVGDGFKVDLAEWNIIDLNTDSLMSFVGSSMAVEIGILRCEVFTLTGNASVALVQNTSGHTHVGLVRLATFSVADAVSAGGVMRITGTGTGSLGAVVGDAVDKSGTTGNLVANLSDAAGKIRYLGPLSVTGTAWSDGDGGGGWSNPSTLYLRNDGLSVLGSKVVGARETGWTAATGTANKGAYATYLGQNVSVGYVEAEAQTTDDAVKGATERIKAIEDALRTHGLID